LKIPILKSKKWFSIYIQNNFILKLEDASLLLDESLEIVENINKKKKNLAIIKEKLLKKKSAKNNSKITF